MGRGSGKTPGRWPLWPMAWSSLAGPLLQPAGWPGPAAPKKKRSSEKNLGSPKKTSRRIPTFPKKTWPEGSEKNLGGPKKIWVVRKKSGWSEKNLGGPKKI